MKEKHKEDLKEAISLFELAMKETNMKKTYFILNEAGDVFDKVWQAYVDYMVQYICKKHK